MSLNQFPAVILQPWTWRRILTLQEGRCWPSWLSLCVTFMLLLPLQCKCVFLRKKNYLWKYSIVNVNVANKIFFCVQTGRSSEWTLHRCSLHEETLSTSWITDGALIHYCWLIIAFQCGTSLMHAADLAFQKQNIRRYRFFCWFFCWSVHMSCS